MNPFRSSKILKIHNNSKIVKKSSKSPKMIGKLTILSALLSTALASTSWSYSGENGPSHWGGVCNTGHRQSPVNIVMEEVEKVNLPPMEFINYNAAGTVEVTNTGHGVETSGFASWSNRPFIQGGGLSARYMLTQFHMHWAQSDNGSEHQIQGQHFPLEMHMVHVKEGLSLSEALKQPDGLAVVGIFHRLCKSGHSLAQLETVIDAVVEQSEGFATLDNYSPIVHLPSNSSAFYRYNGSLTTPECQEAVVWTVLAKPQTMTEQQLELLRTVHGSTFIFPRTEAKHIYFSEN